MKQIIKSTENLLKEQFKNESTGHDWYHLNRVRYLALEIHKNENEGNPFIIEMAALLHDYYDDKLWDSPLDKKKELELFLLNHLKDVDNVKQILHTIDLISYRWNRGKPVPTIEAKIVRDADRLDAIGAIGIARTFAYGGKKGQPIYDPEIKVRTEMTYEEYRHGKSTTINHFYEKLLKLKDTMQTKTGKQMAEERHQFMEEFLRRFLKEWNGEA
ncbi:HD domain-containing protein [Pallidibacillus pasinlerensis]|uniref:HD domain-containing protein n=1 Tax=Pallidibacillus pasinlerensis TaxID=2703818 RepID=A0ABX0A1F2_9BACI|nr:HD domain-containing protein [Pallidibacillus pasinlerensis]NCU17248.1 HD domain-containing protein [Pallidibacillus pasinlerensis]